MKKLLNPRFLLALSLIVIGVSSRLAFHEPNFTPVLAIALFAGAMIVDKRLAFIIPIAAMLIADFIIGFGGFGITLSVYLSFAIAVAIGFWIGSSPSVLKIAGATLVGSIVFFLLTNLTVWLFWGLYPMDFSGLIQCYAAALPFFRNSLLGNAVFTGAFFGAYYLADRFAFSKTTATAES